MAHTQDGLSEAGRKEIHDKTNELEATIEEANTAMMAGDSTGLMSRVR